MNYFSPEATAKRYSIGRPFFHPNTIEKIRQFFEINTDNKFDRVLDIACGTGLSTKPLTNIGKKVIGTDNSVEMLNYAKLIPEIEFFHAIAENQPFNDESFELITVSSGIHWFKIEEFLQECRRLLKQNKYLIIYDNFFISEMINDKSFKNWFPEKYLTKYPSPPRNNQYDWSSKNLNALGFELIKEENFKNQIDFSKQELILYFTTQSNITDEISKKRSTYAEVESWLDKNLKDFFKNESDRKIFNFGNWIKYLKKINPAHNKVQNVHSR